MKFSHANMLILRVNFAVRTLCCSSQGKAVLLKQKHCYSVGRIIYCLNVAIEFWALLMQECLTACLGRGRTHLNHINQTAEMRHGNTESLWLEEVFGGH